MRTVVTWLTEKLPSGWAWAVVGAARTAAMRVSPMASARIAPGRRPVGTRLTLGAIYAINVSRTDRELIAVPPEAGRGLAAPVRLVHRRRPRGDGRRAPPALPPWPLSRHGAGTADHGSQAGGRAAQSGSPERAARRV